MTQRKQARDVLINLANEIGPDEYGDSNYDSYEEYLKAEEQAITDALNKIEAIYKNA